MRREKYPDKGEETLNYNHTPTLIYLHCSKKKKEEKFIDRKNVKYGTSGGDDKTE